jgi:hypothetical protein
MARQTSMNSFSRASGGRQFVSQNSVIGTPLTSSMTK